MKITVLPKRGNDGLLHHITACKLCKSKDAGVSSSGIGFSNFVRRDAFDRAARPGALAKRLAMGYNGPMAEIRYLERRAHSLENEFLQVIVTVEGGHIAALKDKVSGVNPLWTPPWPTMEPSKFDPVKHAATYGNDAESRLLAGILGHNLCMDRFGPPSESEAAAGQGVHGEAPVALYSFTESGDTLVANATFPVAQLAFERKLHLPPRSHAVTITEQVTNLSAEDRPIAWTQHVTLGPPFVEPGKTMFWASATRSKVVESDFTGGKGYMEVGAEFNWPHVPALDGGTRDMQVFPDLASSAAYTAHLMDPSKLPAWFAAWHPDLRVGCGYRWDAKNFPWMGIWEENRARAQAPWGGKTITRGMEFGVSPFPENRRAMLERGEMFGTPTVRWIPALTKVTVSYEAWCGPMDAPPIR